MNLRKEIQKLDELRAAMLTELNETDGIEDLEAAQPMIVTGSKEHETLLSTGYGMDKAQAEAIIKERAEKPERWPYEMLVKAKAFLEALKTKTTVISTRPAWRTRHHARKTVR